MSEQENWTWDNVNQEKLSDLMDNEIKESIRDIYNPLTLQAWYIHYSNNTSIEITDSIWSEAKK